MKQSKLNVTRNAKWNNVCFHYKLSPFSRRAVASVQSQCDSPVCEQRMDNVTVSASDGIAECPLVSDDMEGICVMPDLSAIKTEQPTADDPGTQNVAMGIKFILPNRFDMNVCSRFVKSLNEEDSKNIQDQVNSDLEVASVLFKGMKPVYGSSFLIWLCCNNVWWVKR